MRCQLCSFVIAGAVVSFFAMAGCSSGTITYSLGDDGSDGGSHGSTSSGGKGGSSSGGQSSSGGTSSSNGGSSNGGSGGNSGGSNGGSGGGSNGGSGGSSSGSSGGGSGSSSGGGSSSSSGGMGQYDQFQQHNLDDINMYRAMQNIAPLVLDQQLCTFALAGSTELSMDHSPHQHFIDAGNNGTLWTSGFTSNAGENQGDPNGWPQASNDPVQNELQQIDQIQAAMFAEGPGQGEAHGHYMNMMNSQFTRLGVGLLEINGSLYLTNDFSN